jgi:hypothetical protein
MTTRAFRFVALATLSVCAACFHTTVYTGLPGAGEIVSQPWAQGFIFGLLRPSTVEAATKCKTGVYAIETQHTFANVLASVATAGVYTPMRIDVTCVRTPMVSFTPARRHGESPDLSAAGIGFVVGPSR